MIKGYDWLRAIINGILLVVSFFLVLRVLFLFFSANQATPLVAWVLAVGASLDSPFAGIAPNLTVRTGVLDIVSIVSLILYLLIGYVLLAVVAGLSEQSLETEHRGAVHYHDIDRDEEEEEEHYHQHHR